MAITVNKLLGKSEKGGALAVRPKTNLVPLKKQSSSISKIEKKDEDPMLVIKTKVIKIEDLLKGTLAAEKKAAEEKRKVEEQEDSSEHEITVGNYTTKHFYMCGSAQTVMKNNADVNGAEELTRLQDDFYKLELDSFMKLIEMPKTQQRIKHTLTTGKPLLN